MSSPDATQSTALSTNADPETLIPRQQERLKPLHRATNATDRIPEQTEEDMDVVRNLAREMKREFMQANKDRQEVNRSRTRSVEAYEKLEQVGEGTYGMVFMAKERKTNEIVALKKVRMDNEKEGFPITAIREIKILQKLKHKNVVNLKEIVTSKAQKANDMKGSIYLVFEYMDHDLAGLADRPGMKFSEEQIKCYMKQLFQGLHYCHTNNILHRDIKGSNLLINNKGILKLADFGLARSYTAEGAHPLTNRVITLWYRPPELLLGARKYSPAVDMWSAGCILAELIHGRPIMPGKSEMDQLKLIFELCGTPTPENWPDCKDLPGAKVAEYKQHPRRLREFFRHVSPNALKLIEQLLTLDPKNRLTAEKAMDSDYMWDKPLPCDPAKLPQYEPSHEFQTKKRREEAKIEEVRKRQRNESGSTLNVARPQPIKQQRGLQQTSVRGGGPPMNQGARPNLPPLPTGGVPSGGFNRSAPHQGSYSSGSGSGGGYFRGGSTAMGGGGPSSRPGGWVGGGGSRPMGSMSSMGARPSGGVKYGGTQRAAWADAPAPPKKDETNNNNHNEDGNN